MRAVARVVAERVGERTCCTTVRSEVPLVLRPTGGTLWLVGGAAGPLAGDDLRLDVTVGPGAHLVVRSVAASLLGPGPGPGPSRLHVRAEVGAGAALTWVPEPSIAGRGCDHEATTEIAVAAGGRLCWQEAVVLGRCGEGPGAWSGRLAVDVDATPCLRQDLTLGGAAPAWDGPAVVGPARAVGSVVLVGAPPAAAQGAASAVAAAPAGTAAAVLPTGCGRGLLVTAVADAAGGLLSVLGGAAGRPWWATGPGGPTRARPGTPVVSGAPGPA